RLYLRVWETDMDILTGRHWKGFPRLDAAFVPRRYQALSQLYATEIRSGLEAFSGQTKKHRMGAKAAQRSEPAASACTGRRFSSLHNRNSCQNNPVSYIIEKL